jgi:hypothetical protein
VVVTVVVIVVPIAVSTVSAVSISAISIAVIAVSSWYAAVLANVWAITPRNHARGVVASTAPRCRIPIQAASSITQAIRDRQASGCSRLDARCPR